jgi:hypothetical protein
MIYLLKINEFPTDRIPCKFTGGDKTNGVPVAAASGADGAG